MSSEIFRGTAQPLRIVGSAPVLLGLALAGSVVVLLVTGFSVLTAIAAGALFVLLAVGYSFREPHAQTVVLEKFRWLLAALGIEVRGYPKLGTPQWWKSDDIGPEYSA